MVRRVSTSPLISIVVARDSRQASRSSRILLERANERDVLHHGGGHRGRGVVLAPVEVRVLDLVGRLLVTHAGKDVEVEVHLLGPHAADVEGEVRPEPVRRRLRVVVDHGGGEGQHLEVLGAPAGAGPGEALVERRLEGGHRLGGEEDGEPAVGDLRRQGRRSWDPRRPG